MGIKGRSKADIGREKVLILHPGGSTIFPKQGRVLSRSGLLTDPKQDPVYVWSPVVSKCSKTCGNGERLFNIFVSHFTLIGLKI